MPETQKSRMLFIDNLKFIMITLAVLLHVAVTYSGMGGWYYKEEPNQGLISMLFFFVFQTFSQAYLMGLMFCWLVIFQLNLMIEKALQSSLRTALSA